VETWTHFNGHPPVHHEVHVRVGKPLDVMRFRSFSPEQIEADVDPWAMASRYSRATICSTSIEKTKKVHRLQK